jgi:hypothetical protein
LERAETHVTVQTGDKSIKKFKHAINIKYCFYSPFITWSGRKEAEDFKTRKK